MNRRLDKFGFYRIALATPALKVADVSFNVNEIKSLYQKALDQKSQIICFPELCISGYSAGDLFHNSDLLAASLKALEELALTTQGKTALLIVGLPLSFCSRVYNVAAVLQNGKILGLIPKTHLPEYHEFYEKRWFASAKDLGKQMIQLGSQKIPLHNQMIFSINGQVNFFIEICEDLWVMNPPSHRACQTGAELVFNLSASPEIVGKKQYREDLVRMQSAKCPCIYAYVSAGACESTSDVVFSGQRIVAEGGHVLLNELNWTFASQLSICDVDYQFIRGLRSYESNYKSFEVPDDFQYIEVESITPIENLNFRSINPSPFVPQDQKQVHERAQDIFAIQVTALARRWLHTKSSTVVLGVSGGLDSTLALFVANEAQQKVQQQIPEAKLLPVTMPGPGTSHRTYSQAQKLCEQLHWPLIEINIGKSIHQHAQDIQHDLSKNNITTENIQARERMQILMDLANKERGFVLGTSDLSEIALGWSTYNGDHMSMYNVNCGIPKTLIRHIISWLAYTNRHNQELCTVLKDILDTPISPELSLTKDPNKIEQQTEESIGPYVVHDFFLYHFLRYGCGYEKLLFLASMAFAGQYPEQQLKSYLDTFMQRFFNNQFKRNCMPDGPKIGTISLSPRTDWRMPSDISFVPPKVP